MKRVNLNLGVDGIAFAGFILLTTTGVLLHYVLPPGSGHRSTIWGLDRHSWGEIHLWVALIFLSSLAIHLLLHRRWIVSVLAGRPREGPSMRVGLGLVGLVAVLALAVAPLLTPVERVAAPAGRRDSGITRGSRAESIRGSTTLRELEDLTGIPAVDIIAELNLPADVSLNKGLGGLGAEHGFGVHDVRRIVRERAREEQR